MRSSTSSSRSGWQDARHLLFGVWVTGALMMIAFLLKPAAAGEEDIVTHRLPPDMSEFYLAHDRGGHVDHHVLYHGVDAAARARLATADVLFLGNSRLMFALEPTTVRRVLGAKTLQYYVLGFGHEEQDDFPLAIIRNWDLRPELVVVNADTFFAAGSSDWARRVADESAFDAWKIQFESELTHRVRRTIHRVLPHYVDLRRNEREVVLYRSRADGTWFVANDFGEGGRFAWPTDDRDVPSDAALQAADAFKQELSSRGARLVLCVVPGPNVSLHRARAIAAHLDVPLIVPDGGALYTIDGSHLSHTSAIAVATSLLNQLEPYLPPR